MQHLKYIFILPMMLLSACFAGTAYQPIGTDNTGGYVHEKHSQNHYTVGFVGNGFSKADQVYDFAVLRSAELGEELGYQYFIIEGVHNKTSISKSRGITTYNATPTPGGGFTGIAQPSTTTVAKPGYKLDVRYFDQKPSAREGKSLEIKNTIQELRVKHNLARQQ